MKKIIYLIGQLSFGGTEYQLLELVRHLQHHKILIICLSNNAPLLEDFVKAGCIVHVLNRELRGRLLVLLEIYEIIQEFKPDIIHSFAYASRAVILIPNPRSKFKNIISIRTQLGQKVNLIDRLVYSNADGILTNSEKAMQSIKKLMVNPPIHQVIYNGIDLNKFEKDAKDRTNLDITKKIGTKIICAVARLHPVKGLDVLLDAFFIVAKLIENVELWIVGDGPSKLELSKKAINSEFSSRVIFWGNQKNIPAILKYADVGVLPSHVEGLPNAIIEYMASSIPVIATNVGGIPELISNNINGLLVEPNNYIELSKAIVLLLNDENLAKQFGAFGRTIIENKCDLQTNVLKTDDFYDAILFGAKS